MLQEGKRGEAWSWSLRAYTLSVCRVRSQSPPPGGGQGQRRTVLRVGRGRSSPLGAPCPRGCAQTPGTHPHPHPTRHSSACPCRLPRPRPGSHPLSPLPRPRPGSPPPLGLCPHVAPQSLSRASPCFQGAHGTLGAESWVSSPSGWGLSCCTSGTFWGPE